ncbi:DUF4189 domain-containing protein [Xanthomonas euvesicatoria pv. physalidis]|uniref:DUF4189 domain-containing protein n=1 Tax=Xanthomonas euvesicatoria TaxID=456327 RepID=UPI001C45E00A|nr:DUF4189 domain-containing protein [Xanthomonas euvesicatoria]MBV6689945.1 DUF4189 domain-containing protein [Xanthomonas euvesicatoria pv. physalidis]
MKNKLLTFVLAACTVNAYAEQGCPPGQYPIGGQGVAACAPIPQGGGTQQALPAGKWLKTWGAVASDGSNRLGVSKNKIKKADAQRDALEKCGSVSTKGCKLQFTYQNQCAAVAEPHRGDYSISGIMSYAGAPAKDIADSDALRNCQEKNMGKECRVIYSACSEPIFRPY